MSEVYLAFHEPSDVGGFPVPDVDAGLVRLLPLDWTEKHTHKEGEPEPPPSLVFFDELPSAPQSMQLAAMRVSLERVLGEFRLAANTRCVLAGNPPDVAASGMEMPLPLLNRLCHIEGWEIPEEIVATGFTTGWPKVDIPDPDMSRVEGEVASSKAVAAAFWRVKPGSLRTPKDKRGVDGYGFGTPRSWETAMILHGWAKASNASGDAIKVLLDGTIGHALSVEFRTFFDSMDLPDPEMLLHDPSSWSPDRDRADRVHAVASSVMAALSRNNTPERWLAAGEVVSSIVDGGFAEIGYLYARPLLHDMHLHRGQVGASSRMTSSLRPILEAMGRLQTRESMTGHR